MLKPLNKDAPIAKSRRNLPNWQQHGCTYFITWRLGDSVPLAKLREWEAARKAFHAAHPEDPWAEATWDEYHRTITVEMERWLDAGHGSCVMRRPALRDIVTTALHFFDGDRYRLGEFVIMPNHVHVLITPHAEWSISDILRSLKRHTAREVNKVIEKTGTPLWQDESFHHAVRSELQWEKFQRYIADNPAKARLRENEYTLGKSSRSENEPCNEAGQRSTGLKPVPGKEERGESPNPEPI